MSTRREVQAIDLFCGAGGLSAGLERSGWRIVAAVDHDRDCIETLRAAQSLRLPISPASARSYLEGASVVHADIRDIRAKDLRPANVGGDWTPDLLTGGPPCQPFSSAGRQRGLSDPRGQLFVEFVRLAEELRPRFLLFENVAGLITAKDGNGNPGGVLELVQRSFERIGYACRCGLLNAVDYGSAQRRVRLFILASATEELPNFPLPTHARVADALGWTQPWRTLADFLATACDPDFSEIVTPSPARAGALAALKPGSGLRARGIVEANRPGGHWGYRQDCFLADLSKPARTIRAASTPDWIRCDNGSLRRLTWRECGALQGFPEAWPFVGTIASKFRQIGNAVEGHVAQALGNTLANAVVAARPSQPMSAAWPQSFHRRVRYTRMEQRVNEELRWKARASR